ncbi:hypothetical protein P0Y35_11970 [Kiritimatiellaeota bacterium B1221]|nr:hypothetical protein [Kiritimatiellaeota bacterium B1221]
MKLKQLLLASVFSTLSVLQTAQAYEPPTAAQITNMLANPKMITQLLGDANGKEAATLMKRIIERIQATEMAKKQKDYLISFYSGRLAALLNAAEADAYATELMSIAPAESLGTVLAGLSVSRGGSSSFVALLKELAGDNPSLQTAISTPNVTLTDPVYSLLETNLDSAQSIAPSPIDSVPPSGGAGAGAGTGTTPPPVIPAPYNGQG